MICEMCGQDTNMIKKINVEGSLLSVCPNCMKFGTELEVEKEEVPRRSGTRRQASGTVEERLAHRERRMKSKNIYDQDSSDELVVDYHKVIQKARMDLGMNQEELARKLNERKSIIAKLETKSLHPDNKLIRKLEKELKITLTERID
jgi:putative transcription factor